MTSNAISNCLHIFHYSDCLNKAVAFFLRTTHRKLLRFLRRFLLLLRNFCVYFFIYQLVSTFAPDFKQAGKI